MKFYKFLFIATILLLGSCNRSNQTKTTDFLKEIHILGENSSNLQAMEALKSDFEIASGNKVVFYPNSFEDASNKANQDFVNKTGLYDIVLQYNFSLSSFVKNDYIVPLSSLKNELPDSLRTFENDIFPNVWKEVGHYYQTGADTGIQEVGYPFAANTMFLVYNRDLFENEGNRTAFKAKYGKELNAPTDWEHYKQVAEFFTQPEKGIKGVSVSGAAHGWLYYEFCNYLLGYDVTVMSKQYGWEGNASTPLNLTSDKALAATEYYLSLKPYCAGTFDKTDGSEQINLIKSGKAAMGIIWSDYAYSLVYDDKGSLNKSFAFAPIPGSKSILAGGSFYINKNSKLKVEAFKYIGDLLQSKNQVALFKKGLCSPVQSVYENVEVKEIPYSNALFQSLKQGVYALEAGPDATLISDKITEYIQQAWAGKLKAKDALAKAQEEILKDRADYFK